MTDAPTELMEAIIDTDAHGMAWKLGHCERLRTLLVESCDSTLGQGQAVASIDLKSGCALVDAQVHLDDLAKTIADHGFDVERRPEGGDQ